MNLRCKVFRAADVGDLEEGINRFLAEVPDSGSLQLEEITQSESAAGVTLVLWYSLAGLDAARGDGEDVDADFEGYDEVDGKELA